MGGNHYDIRIYTLPVAPAVMDDTIYFGAPDGSLYTRKRD